MYPEPDDLSAERAQWRTLVEKARMLHQKEWSLRRSRPHAGSYDDFSLSMSDAQKEAQAEVRADTLAGLAYEIERVEDQISRMSISLAMQSRKRADMAIRHAEFTPRAELRMRWELARETVLEGLAERVTALVRSGAGTGDLARRAGISGTQITRIMRGERATDATLRALARAEPEEFRDLIQVLDRAPSMSPAVGRPPGKSRPKANEALEAGLARLASLPQYYLFNGRLEQVSNSVRDGLALLDDLRIDYIIKSEAHMPARSYRWQRLLLISENMPPQVGSTYLVETTDGRRALYQYVRQDDGSTAYRRMQPREPIVLSPSEATVVGGVVGSISIGAWGTSGHR